MPENVPAYTPDHRPKKRKLRHPRTANACAFCRKRKVRCSGTQPCDYCIREESVCEYTTAPRENPISPPTDGTPIATPQSSSNARLDTTGSNNDPCTDSRQAPSVVSSTSRQSSIGAPQAFVNGHHVGPTSGVSFLYHPWDTTQPHESRAALEEVDPGLAIARASLVSYGDTAPVEPTTLRSLPEPTFSVTQILDILDRYFQSISPTYRFLHHPTSKKWAIAYANQDRHLPAVQKASVLLICAQTLLHTSAHPGEPEVGEGDLMLSMACSERAKSLLDKEPGPPSLASVQARIGMCLYFLSTFRLNECRYCFSFAVTVATALGLQRRQSSNRVGLLEGECRKRAFWSLYVLDSYLSVMLGRPRLLRDEDIDQPYPYNIDDNDLVCSEPIESLPHHGNLEAFINHAKLARITARNNDLLYPIRSLTNDELFSRSGQILDELKEWQNALPDFLKPRGKTLTGQRTFERQNTILKLALAHVRILATRRCLLTDFSRINTNSVSQSQDVQPKRPVGECVLAIITILDAVEALIQGGQCYGSFWSTQYIALVAISTLYVIIIQGVRHALPSDIQSVLNVEESLARARKCHEHLVTLPPPGSQAERHFLLLGHLRSKAEKSLSRHKNLGGVPKRTTRQRLGAEQSVGLRHSHENHISDRGSTSNNTIDFISSQMTPEPSATTMAVPAGLTEEVVPIMPSDAGDSSDMTVFSTMFTPTQGSDSGFQYLLDLGWESLDTIGIPMSGYNMDEYGTM